MLEVIGAGLDRTGRHSLRAALARLGYGPCHHMPAPGECPESIGGWDAAARGEPVDWGRLLAGYRAAVDWPACAFWRELMDGYPRARVVLTVRDPDAWYASARRTIYRDTAAQAGLDGLLMRLEDRLCPALRRRRQICRRLLWEETFGGRFDDRDYAIEVYLRHNAIVRERVPADRLLEFDVREGWEPLCDFLGAAVPAGPFPHLNDTAAFRRLAALRRRRTLTLRGPAAGGGARPAGAAMR
jgi:hypothetical protein